MSIPYLTGHPFLRNIRYPFLSCLAVSIPYLTGHPFLLPFRKVLSDLFCHCVNPLSNRTPISTKNEIINAVRKHSVSIPYLTGHPFLPSPPKLLDFMRPPRLDFAGIYQTILIKGMFLGF